MASSNLAVERPFPLLLSVDIRPNLQRIPQARVLVGNASATSTKDPRDTAFEHWIDTLEKTVHASQSTAPWLPIFVLAEFNAELGRHPPHDADTAPPLSSVHGGYSLGTQNARGARLHTSALKAGLLGYQHLVPGSGSRKSHL